MENINFTNVKFIKSAPEKKDFLFDRSGVLFLGKSNVGKSSFINMILQRKNLMKVSSTPGRTRMLNYTLIDDKFYFIDAPGYGYFKKPADFENMMLDYFQSQKGTCKLCFVLVDSRRLLSQDDKQIISLIAENGIPFVVIYTKKDKLKQKELHLVKKEIETTNYPSLIVSNLDQNSFIRVREIISEKID